MRNHPSTFYNAAHRPHFGSLTHNLLAQTSYPYQEPHTSHPYPTSLCSSRRLGLCPSFCLLHPIRPSSIKAACNRDGSDTCKRISICKRGAEERIDVTRKASGSNTREKEVNLPCTGFKTHRSPHVSRYPKRQRRPTASANPAWWPLMDCSAASRRPGPLSTDASLFCFPG